MTMMGYAFCGSFCTLSRSLAEMERLISQGYEIMPIASRAVATTDTRFWKCADFRARVESASGKRMIDTIVEAEPIGPSECLDVLVVAPCTGNTLAKLACGITDTPVCMAVKAQLRSDRPVVIALASNDAMSANLQNIAVLSQRKNIYFVPMSKNDPIKKPHSLVADFEKTGEIIKRALEGTRNL